MTAPSPEDLAGTHEPARTGHRLLLASLGTGQYKPVTYRFAGEEHTSELAPAAVCRLIKPRPSHVGVLVTRAARAMWLDELARQLGEIGVAADPIDVPEGRSEDELLQIFKIVIDYVSVHVEPHGALVLDVTLALRHLPFVYLASLTYLSALRDVSIDGIYYAAHDLGDGQGAPILDITALLSLVEWHAALRSARGWGDFRPLAERVSQDAGRLFKVAEGDPKLSRAANRAQKLARASASALPLEIGIEAARFLEAVRQLDATPAPLAQAARLALDDLALKSEALPVSAPNAKPGKGDIPLDKAELRRQLALAERYARGHAVPSTLIVLREWLVNLVLHLDGRGGDWLAHAVRERAEGQLRGLHQRLRDGLAAPEERALGAVWASLHEARNAYAHAGFRPDGTDVSDERLERYLADCRALLDEPPRLSMRAGDRLLVTPLGRSPGVLFSAVMHAQPARALVITSAQACDAIPEALAKAGAPELPHTSVNMGDPHFGFDESRGLAARPDLRWLLAEAGEVVVNLTGGTTTMAHVVQRLGEEARALGTRVRRIALIDRRTPEEQRGDPYVLGEIAWLDSDEGAG